MATMSDDSIAPLLNSLTSALSKNKRSISSHPPTGSVDRALGAAASLGLSLAILRLVVFTYKAFKRLEDGKNVDDDSIPDSGEGHVILPESAYATWSDSVYATLRYLVRRFLRRALLEDPHESKSPKSSIECAGEMDCTMITHQGSCHCESVKFEVLAPRCLIVKNGPGKIQYQHTQVQASSFRVIMGKEDLKTYYVVVNSKDTTQSRGAHAFCSKCGVHILYARSKNSPTLEINVLCLNEGIRKIRIETSRDTIADSVPVEGQWDDQLETIAESKVDSRFTFQSPPASLSNFSTEASLQRGNSSEYESTGKSLFSEKDPNLTTPATPSTLGSTTANDSLLAPSLPISVTADQDSIATESTTSSQGVPPLSSKPVLTPKSFESKRMPSAATAQVRDKMRYYMGKHLSSSSSNNGDEEKKSPR